MALKSVLVSAHGVSSTVDLTLNEVLALQPGERLIVPSQLKKKLADLDQRQDPDAQHTQVFVDEAGNTYSVFLPQGSEVEIAQAEPIASVNDSPLTTAGGPVVSQPAPSPVLPPNPNPHTGEAVNTIEVKPPNPHGTAPASSGDQGSAADFVIPVLGGLAGVGLLVALANDDNNHHHDDTPPPSPPAPPVITSNGGGSGAAASVVENSTAVTTVIATDANGDTLTYAVTGGADQARFAINGVTGALSFISAPNFENPTDSDKNNTYEVTVSASDGKLSDTQTLIVTVTDVPNENAVPVITSDGGGVTAALGVVENTKDVTIVKATDGDGDPVTFTIAGGEDAKFFTIDKASGLLQFITAPDFEGAQDVGGDNKYAVIVSASDGKNGADTQTITVTVSDSNEGGGIPNAIPQLKVPIPDQTVAEDSALTFVVPLGTFADPNPADVLTFSAALENGSPLPEWLKFDTATHTFSGTPDNDDVGAINVRVTASDGKASVDDIFALTVTNVNDAPTVATPLADQTAVGNLPFNFTFAPDAFKDVDVGDTLTYTATVTGGTAAWLNFDPLTRTFSGNPTNADAANLVVHVTASDGALSVTDDFDLKVSVNQPAVITGTVTGTVTESGAAGAGTPTASGDLTVVDPDGPVDAVGFKVVTDVATTHGHYSVTADGVWTYALNNADPIVDALTATGNLADSFAVQSVDGTSKNVTIDIKGANDAPTFSGLVVNEAGFSFIASDPDNGASPVSSHDGLLSIPVHVDGSGTLQLVAAQAATAVDDDYLIVDDPDGNLPGGQSPVNVPVLDLYLGTNGDNSFTVVTPSTAGVNAIYGFDGSDTLTGGSGVDYIFGGNGIDILNGSGGNDVIFGGSGEDQITGGAGNDIIDVKDSNDTIFYLGAQNGPTAATNGSDVINNFDAQGNEASGDLINLDAFFDSMGPLGLADGARGEGTGYLIVASGANQYELFIDLDGNVGAGGNDKFEYLLATVNVTAGVLDTDDIHEGLLLGL